MCHANEPRLLTHRTAEESPGLRHPSLLCQRPDSAHFVFPDSPTEVKAATGAAKEKGVGPQVC